MHMKSASTGRGTEMSAQATHLLAPQVRRTHRAWYFSVAALVIAAVVAIALMIANSGSSSSAGTGTTTHRAPPAATQVAGASDYQFKVLP